MNKVIKFVLMVNKYPILSQWNLIFFQRYFLFDLGEANTTITITAFDLVMISFVVVNYVGRFDRLFRIFFFASAYLAQLWNLTGHCFKSN